MKKSIYIILITVITLVCIVLGCFRFVFHAGQQFFNIFSNNTEETTSEISVQNEQEIDAFTSIKVDVNVIDVTVVTGDNYSISYDCDSRITPTYEVKDGTLVVKQKDKGWSNLSFNNINCEMIITVPADVTLDSLDIFSDVGDIDVSEIKAKKTTIDTDVGDVTFKNAELGKSEFTLDTGDIELDNCKFGNLTIKASVGDVDIDSATDLSDYDMDISTSVGDIKINGKNYEENYKRSGNGKNKISIDNSTGDIDITY